jgi:signal transduction histidine kinase
VGRVSVARPIEALVTSVRSIGDGDWGAVVPVRRPDELGRLTEEFNRMRLRLAQMHASLSLEQDQRRRIESDLREAERLASLGRFAAGVAHEIGTPLNVIGGRAESLLRRVGGDEVAARGLRIIAEQIERISRIVRGVLDFARKHELRIVPTDLGQAIDKVVELIEEPFEGRGVTIEAHVSQGLPRLAADPDQLHQVFLNLALNAAESMPSGGRLRIAAGLAECVGPAEDAAPRACVTVAFEDTGCGIAPGNLEHVFEPFFTTKEVGGGTGLGLAVSYGIVREHGGWIDVASALGQGTRMTVCLPLAASERPATTAASREPA